MSILAPLSANALDLAVPRLRRIALRNLELAGFDNPPAIADGVFRSLGRVIESVARFPKLNRENIHQLHSLRGSGKLHRAPKPRAGAS